MTRTAEQAVVLEPALTAAIGHRDDVVRFPPRTRGAPGLASGAVGAWRFRARPFAVRLDDVEAAQPAGALVALLDLLPHVPRAAADLPFVDARVAAEGPPRTLDRRSAPPADRPSEFIEIRFAPVVSRDRTRTKSAHVGVIGSARIGCRVRRYRTAKSLSGGSRSDNCTIRSKRMPSFSSSRADGSLSAFTMASTRGICSVSRAWSSTARAAS